jgi:hypothetical protein
MIGPTSRPMSRVRVLAAIGVLLAGLSGCSDRPPATTAAPAASVASAETPVPQETSAQPAAASPRPRRTSPAPAARPTRTADRAAEAGSGNAGLDQFVAAVQQRLPAVAMDRRDEEVEELGEQACDSLAAGQTATAAAGEISDQGVELGDARKLVALARSTACPGRPKV